MRVTFQGNCLMDFKQDEFLAFEKILPTEEIVLVPSRIIEISN